MRVLVYPHDMAIGGSQLNAIEIAAAVDRLGHPTVIFGPDGPLVDRVRALGLEFITAPDPSRRPSLRVVSALRTVLREREIDVVHGYEWPPALESLIAARGGGAAAVATVMSMAVAPFLPRALELVVGTEQIATAEREGGRDRVHVIEPPVDLAHNDPLTVVGVEEFRTRWGLDDTRLTVVCVTRLAHQLKLEGILAAIEAVGHVSSRIPMRLVIVGDGPARADVARRAAAANARFRPGTVVLTGELADPRAAYSSADIALGMGGSALRSMAYGVPLVVQGENGFWELLTPETLQGFLWRGWYGYGREARTGPAVLESILHELGGDPHARAEFGAFARSVVEDRFSLDRAAHLQLAVYERARARPADRRHTPAGDGAALVGFATYKLRGRIQRTFGRGATDDFNANPVARVAADRTIAGTGSDVGTPVGVPRAGVVVYFSGASWDAVRGTDRQIVTALGRHREVLWVDPPMSWLARRRRQITVPRLTQAAPGVVRLHTVALPGVGRPVIRRIAGWQVRWSVLRLLRAQRRAVAAVIASTPESVLPAWRRSRAVTVYYATDDFVAGAGLLGSSVAHADRARRANLACADVVLAVSEPLAARLRPDAPSVAVLANGCDATHYRGAEDQALLPAELRLAAPIAGVVGQLNDRLAPEVLEAVADTGASLLLVGPRYEEQPEMRARLDRLIARPNVQWVGRKPFEDLPSYLGAMTVGLTPYADTEFNRASFPLKTLEYLAAGCAVVSTDLPSARDLDTDLISIEPEPIAFAATVVRLLKEPRLPGRVERGREFAARHSWEARAAELDRLIQ